MGKSKFMRNFTSFPITALLGEEERERLINGALELFNSFIYPTNALHSLNALLDAGL